MTSAHNSKSGKLRLVAVETTKRRRAEGVRVLDAINGMIPRTGDVDGRAGGIVGVLELAARAGVSGKAAARALAHWRNWRVLWLWWKGKRYWEVRFERSVLDDLLSTPPSGIGAFLLAHKRRREAEALLLLTRVCTVVRKETHGGPYQEVNPS
jgi:hypothetical protein